VEPERWQRIDQLCHAALEVDESRRAAFIEEACAEDEILRHEVESLLAHPERESFLEIPAVELAAENPAARAGGPRIPALIGRYRVVRLLGEGGMGAVYEAEQDQPRRVVALKVIRAGFATPEALRRFQHESQALGRLQHPGIAQIHEAGTADTGFGPQPYFAMELIRGQALLEYVEAHKLTTRDRLALMAKICDAVDHAHQRGVLHRDLKPGNILIDETAQPKILDFGVARVAESEAQHTRQTELGQLVGTLAYMSPEQVAGDPSALDSRSDVYALGVITYELLAGRPPYNIGRKPLPEAVGIIREEEPAPLSTINRHYRGDIDTIVAKALEKDKARRYGSAAEMAADIRRHLSDQPIAARPASATYQLRKFTRRHKALVSGAALVCTVLATGVVAISQEALRARRAEQVSEVVNAFLRDDLLAQASPSTQAGPTTNPDPDLKVRTALDRAAARINGKFDRQPEVEAAIRDTIGQAYFDLGVYPEASAQLARALELRRRVLGAENPKTVTTMTAFGAAMKAQGKTAEAVALLSQALQLQRRVSGPAHPDTIAAMIALAGANLEASKLAQTYAISKQALEVSIHALGPDHPMTLNAMEAMATAHTAVNGYEQAKALLEKTVDGRRRVLGPEHPATLRALHELAASYERLGDFAQCQPLYRRLLDTRRRLLGPEHPDTLNSMNALANMYLHEGNCAEAIPLYIQAVEISGRVMGPEHPRRLEWMGNLAVAYRDAHQYPQAEALNFQLLEIKRRVLGPEHRSTLFTLWNVVLMYQQERKYRLAESYGKQVLAGRRRAFGSEAIGTLDSAADLALAYESQGKFASCEPLAREAFDGYSKKLPDVLSRFEVESLLGACLVGQKKFAEAEPLLIEAYQGLVARKRRMDADDLANLPAERNRLVQLYKAWGKPEKAIEWRLR